MEVARRGACWCQELLCYFVCSEVSVQQNDSVICYRRDSTGYVRSTTRTIACDCGYRSTVDALNSAFAIQVPDNIEDALVLRLAALTVYLYAISTGSVGFGQDERTCSSTFARSTGAVTRVVGTADKKPAAASSAVVREASLRVGVKA